MCTRFRDRCDEIFANTHPSPSSSSSSSTTTATSSSTHGGYDKRCMYASTCNGGDGLLLPFVFFLTPHNNRHDYDYDDASTPTLTLTSTTTMSSSGQRDLAIHGIVACDPVAPAPAAIDAPVPITRVERRRILHALPVHALVGARSAPPVSRAQRSWHWGNGACDISVTVAAISSDNAYGYQMLLGGLTGGGWNVRIDRRRRGA